ncbi:MAG TPA: hypothetical protein PKD86_14035, partial [Gemmatales bacterium]|nr:hypothetical protein [Gemmatales bacterium]
MLFSRTDLAEYIQDHFEPVWQEVRSVPLVHLDFGAGQRLTRTLHGNIATWVCLPDGSAADVLPGLRRPQMRTVVT